jgi:hypothetical protein
MVVGMHVRNTKVVDAERTDSTHCRFSFTQYRIIMLCFIERPKLGRASTSIALAGLHGINLVNRVHTVGHHHHMEIVAAMVTSCFDSNGDHDLFNIAVVISLIVFIHPRLSTACPGHGKSPASYTKLGQPIIASKSDQPTRLDGKLASMLQHVH